MENIADHTAHRRLAEACVGGGAGEACLSLHFVGDFTFLFSRHRVHDSRRRLRFQVLAITNVYFVNEAIVAMRHHADVATGATTVFFLQMLPLRRILFTEF